MQNNYGQAPLMGTRIENFASEGSANAICLSPNLMLPVKTANEVWSVYGKRGSGKSYFLGKLCEELSRLNIPFIIIDVKNAHSLINLPGVVHTHTTKTRPDKIVMMAGEGQSTIISCKGTNVDEMRVYVTDLCEILNRVNFGPSFGRPVMVALEECHNFIGQGQGTAGGKGEIRSQCTASVDKLIREGRQDGIGAILISQSVANVLANVRRQAEVKILFNIKDHTDIKQLRDTLIGKNKDEVNAIIEKVYNFDVGEFVCVSPTYIGGSGIVIDKTSSRTTEHAGRSFLEDGNIGATGIPDAFTFEPDFSPLEIGIDAPEEKPEELEESYSALPKTEKKIDYKTALSFSLLALSVIGIVAVILKKRMEKKELETEQEIEEKLKAERRKIEVMKKQMNDEGKVNYQPPKAGDLLESLMESPDFEEMGPGDPFSDMFD